MEAEQSARPSAATAPMPVEEIAQVLALHPTFRHFDRAALREVAARCGSATFAAGVTIMRQGDPGNFAYLILEGEAEVFVEIPAGRIPMATLGRHQHDRRARRLHRHAAHRHRRRPHRSRHACASSATR